MTCAMAVAHSSLCSRDKNIMLVLFVEWPQRLTTTTPCATTLTFYPTWISTSQMMPLPLTLPCTSSSLLNSGTDMIEELKNQQCRPSAVSYKITLDISVGAMSARVLEAYLCTPLLVDTSWLLVKGESFRLLNSYVKLLMNLIKGCAYVKLIMNLIKRCWISVLST